MQDLKPRHVHGKHDPDIRKQRKSEPFEHPDVSAIGDKHFQAYAQRADSYDVEMPWASDHQRNGVSHGGEIGSDVDGVGDEQQADQAIQHRGRIMASNVSSQAMSGHTAN